MSKVKILILILIIVIVSILKLNEVTINVTAEDRDVISKLELDSSCSNISNFEKEVLCVEKIQEKIFSIIKISFHGIGINEKREPKDLILIAKGLCYDRSRFIEKIFQYYDIEFRHVSIHFTKDNSKIPFLSANAHSHAFSEILTKKGWMLVDSIDLFLGLDNQYNVFSAIDLRNQKKFIDKNNHILPINFQNSYYSVSYGLYSRTGRLYPPFNPIPDINWKQFLSYNLFPNNK